jgi:hypothetical protein
MQSPTEVQLELMTALLEGEDPDAWVCIPVSALVSQITVVLNETTDNKGPHRPGRVSTRLVKNLFVSGWIRDSKYQQQRVKT